MRREPHSYPWCNLEGVKRATVGKEQGSAKQTLKNKNSQHDLFLHYQIQEEGKGGSQSMEHFHNSADISDAAVTKIALSLFKKKVKTTLL